MKAYKDFDRQWQEMSGPWDRDYAERYQRRPNWPFLGAMLVLVPLCVGFWVWLVNTLFPLVRR